MEGDIKNVILYWMEGEIENFIKVWLSVYASLFYCYFSTKILPKGLLRFFSFVPVICFFLYLPLKLNSVHLCGTTAFFISWLCNFKLLLLAFGLGPLSDSSLSIIRFLIIACLPIKIQQKSQEKSDLFVKNGHFQETSYAKSAEKTQLFVQNDLVKETPYQKSAEKSELFVQNGHFQDTPYSKSAEKVFSVQNRKVKGANDHQNGHFKETPSQKSADNSIGFQNGKHRTSQNGHFQESPLKKGPKSAVNYGIKAILFALILRVYDYSDYIHPHIILVIYCFHIYFCLEIILAIVAGLARGLLGLELEPQFNEPYLSTSLQDFWGRRWNLMVTRILRPTVYSPTLNLSTNILGRKWAPLPAVMATFVVSGLMHELIFYYFGRVKPTWEVTWFFLLHGVCLNIEICMKKVINGSFKLPRFIGTILTIAFVMVTGFWLFFPQMLRCNSDVRAFKEYEAIGAFFKDVTRAVNVSFLR